MNGINKKMTDKEFKEFTRELCSLMKKYNIFVKMGSEEIIFGNEGRIISYLNGFFYCEREIRIAFTEFLTKEQAKKEKENGILIL